MHAQGIGRLGAAKHRRCGRTHAATVQCQSTTGSHGHSFDGLDYRFIEPLSRHAPEDYTRDLDWFPLAELELLRHDLTR